MDGLIILIILIPLVFLILLISIYSRTGEQQRLLESLYDKIKQLNNEVSSLTRELKNNPAVKEIKKEEAKIIPSKPVTTEAAKPVQETIVPPVPSVPEWLKKQEVLPDAKEEVPAKPVTGEKKSWLPENADWEKFIGENLANKIGITVLVLGIAFFVKYAIDKDWINETGRVIIGLVSGGILIGLAHYFRNSYRSFSSVLVGGGLTVFYFSVAFAFHQYHLIGQATAFICMVIIAGLGVVLSLFYNRQELAILATIGGFITPFLASTGNENYVALFTYLAILNTGLMVLAWFKRWPSINVIALFFTLLIYGGWLVTRTIFTDDPLPHGDAFLFATLFYFQFLLMNIINSIRLKNKFGSFDFIILFSINFLYYAAGMIILDGRGNENHEGLFTLLLGIVNLLLAAFFYRRPVDRNFVSLLTGLAISFISLAAPVQFKGNHITLFWAAEMVVLFWLYQRTRMTLLRSAAFFLAAIMLISLVLIWGNIYLTGTTMLPVILNKGFITTLTAAVSLFIFYSLLCKEKDDEPVAVIGFSTRKTFLVLAITVSYFAGALEIFYQFSTRYPQAPLYLIYLQVFSFITAILLLHIFKKEKKVFNLRLAFSVASYIFYFFSFGSNLSVSKSLLTGPKSNLFAAHWVAVLLLCWLLYRLIHAFFRQTEKKWIAYRPAFSWIASAAIILLLSFEMYHIILRVNYENHAEWNWWENLYFKAGLTVLWGLCSFAMMWLGMKKNYRPLRIISLTLFTVTLTKLFLFDIRNIPPGGKIVAFILLGVLLLAVSFMYQRLKKIIIDNQTA